MEKKSRAYCKNVEKYRKKTTTTEIDKIRKLLKNKI